MAYESDSLTRRTLGPTLASAVIGIALGLVAVVGISALQSDDQIAGGSTVSADNAVLGDPEYGSR
ncbi:DUF2613 domain-containing protein [Corynebacterium sp. 153RC1]|uniref:DUF2613 domain-containing protein n=1 Tax=Corynebacterium TaxID=1716 RepID=UPI00211BDCBC|nr:MULTISPECIES: DUF2613 domain-containing protein [unclassified Corynebacterium]MCQ9370833.1 DUF2613 domain-containing protein [Corynebacterium sp. 35RC1]MCQ9342943.1 DUF2613 domain-containing protein [Corynebacterium sp. 76QC2CO]MCQ9352662.1 DUF2613 domain-containing protein [Corynebacterium sp. 209RC1]MCQ9354846.1 DUF2613 domain-containing protein [Corynebacterium sp. 1222RC1]MCQ9357031.1 DUF2613 domain-containing protein [Corynebacterium sp. 122RC1]